MPDSFFDTNVILYAAREILLPKDEYKRPLARELFATRDFAISSQVLAEFYHNAVKDGPSQMPNDEAEIWLDDLCGRPCNAVNVDLVREGVAYALRYKISYWDGAIVAAANAQGVSILYTEDLNHGQRYGDVTAVNPFLPQAH